MLLIVVPPAVIEFTSAMTNVVPIGNVVQAAALVRDEVDPLDDVRGSAGYKREMARVWTERTIAQLGGIGVPA